MKFKLYKIPLDNVSGYRAGLKLQCRVSFTGITANMQVLVTNGTCSVTTVNSSLTTDFTVIPSEAADTLYIRFASNGLDLSQHIVNFEIIEASNSEDGDSYELQQQYSPIHTLQNSEEFKVNFKHNKEVQADIVLQSSYDNSINVIFADGVGPARLVNTGIIFTNSLGTIPKNHPVYNKDSLYTTELIPKYNTLPSLSFDGTFSGGSLKAGGYKYYIKYTTRDDIETDIVEESRLVSVHPGSTSTDSYGGDSNEVTDKYVTLTLSGIDPAYKKLAVYYTYYSGDVAPTGVTYKILSDYNVTDDGTCTILHSGFEAIEEIQADALAKPYNHADIVKTITSSNNRLLLGNMTNTSIDDETLSTAALQCFVTSEQRYASGYYTDPNVIYNGISYWDGETYEFGIVFVTHAGNSEVYPIMGIDGTITETYDTQLFGNRIDGHFVESSGQNDLGLFRFPCNDDTRSFARSVSISELYPKIDTTHLQENKDTLKAKGVLGFFVVKRKRKPDMLVEGLVAPTTTVSVNTMTNTSRLIMNGGNYTGLGASDSGNEPTSYSKSPLGNNYVYVPFMYGCLPFTNDLYDNDKPGLHSILTFTPVFRFENFIKYAMYSPDFICAEPTWVSNYPGGGAVNLCFNGVMAGTSHYKAYDEAFPLLDFSQDENNTVFYNIYATTTNTVKHTTITNKGKAQYIAAGSLGVSPTGFSGTTDRQLYNEVSFFIGTGDNKPSKSRQNGTVNDMFPSKSPTDAYVAGAHGFIVGLRDAPDPPKIWGHSADYNSYMGIEFTSEEFNTLMKTYCLPVAENARGNQKNFYCSLFKYPYTRPPRGEACAGAYTRMYSTEGSGNGYMSPLAWRSRYKSTSGEPYHAVTHRSDLDVSAVIATSGDCFVGDFSQQLFFGKGITGVPTATDPAAYYGYQNGNTREALNMAPIGISSTVPMRSNYNFSLRSLEEADETETKLYNAKRSFIPLKSDRQVYGNRQHETRAYNYGHVAQEESILQYYQYDADKPFSQYTYNNRVSVSATGVEGNFTNGFRDFSGLNFKEYNKELGEIVSMHEMQGKVYLIFNDGISVINVDERSMLTTSTGSVYTDAATVLSPKSQVISSVLGSTYKSSIFKSDKALYGVDAQKHKVWRISSKGIETISDFKVQSLISKYSDAGVLKNIYTTYDTLKQEVQFTFICVNGTFSLLFSEMLNAWSSRTDIHKLYSMNLNGNNWFISEAKSTGLVPGHCLVKPNTEIKNSYTRLDGTIDALDVLFKYVVNHNPEITKTLDVFTMNGSLVYPEEVTFNAETIEEYSQPLYYNSNYYKNTYCSVSAFNKNVLSIKPSSKAPANWLDVYNFNIGELLTIINPDGSVVKTKVAGLFDGDSTILFVSETNLNIQEDATIMRGWRYPNARITAEAEENHTRVQVWRKSSVDALKGDTKFSAYSALLNSDAKLRGNWISVEVHSKDFSPMYINSIDSIILKSDS